MAPATQTNIYGTSGATVTAAVAQVVSQSVPTGTVQFVDGSTNLGLPIPLNGSGVATLSLTPTQLAVGTHQITGQYSGDLTYSPTTSAKAATVIVTTNVTRLDISIDGIPVPNGNVENVPYSTATTVEAVIRNLPPSPALTPVGTVQFSLNGTPYGSPITVQPLNPLDPASNAFANLTPPLPITQAKGNYTIDASYTPSSSNFSPAANFGVLSIGMTDSTVQISVAPPNPVYGQSVAVNAFVSSTFSTVIPSGTVVFYDETGPGQVNKLGQATIDVYGNALFTATSLDVYGNMHHIIAYYTGDNNFAGSRSATNLNVTPAATITTLVAGPGTTVYGQGVTLTATVTSAAGNLTGDVEFFADGNPLQLGAPAPSYVKVDANGVATLTTKNLPVGIHSVLAVYNGTASPPAPDSDLNHLASGSNTVAGIQVLQAPTITSLAIAPASPAYGDAEVITATVTGPYGPAVDAPLTNGTVTIVDNSTATTLLGATVLNSSGQVSVTIAAPGLSLGSHSLTATYSGTSNYLPSVGNLAVIITPNGTTTVLSINPLQPAFGNPVAYSVTVTSNVNPPAPTPTGTIQLMEDGKPFEAPFALGAGGTATMTSPNMPGGVHSVTAVYSGDTNNSSSTSAPVVMTVGRLQATAHLSASPTSGGFGTPITFTTNVAPATSGVLVLPTGTVQLQDNGSNVGASENVDGSGNAVVTISDLTVGTHTITANYSGDSNFIPATSNTVTITIGSVPNQGYVAAVYNRLLNRAPDTAGLLYWTQQLNSGAPRWAVSASIVSSYEYRSDIVTGLYQRYLHRGTDAGGLAFWAQSLANGTRVESLAAMLVGSDEYYAASGGTASGWVSHMYQDILGRAVDPVGAAYFEGQATGGSPRTWIASNLLYSPEALTATVNGYYQTLLGRTLDPAGSAFWVGQLQHGVYDQTIASQILASDEFYNANN